MIMIVIYGVPKGSLVRLINMSDSEFLDERREITVKQIGVSPIKVGLDFGHGDQILIRIRHKNFIDHNEDFHISKKNHVLCYLPVVDSIMLGIDDARRLLLGHWLFGIAESEDAIQREIVQLVSDNRQSRLEFY